MAALSYGGPSPTETVFTTRFWALFLNSRASANFLFKNSHLVTIATVVGLAPLNCAIIITPCLVQHSRFYPLS